MTVPVRPEQISADNHYMAFLGGFPHFVSKEKENLQIEKVHKNKKKNHNAPESVLFPKFSQGSMPTDPPPSQARLCLNGWTK